MKNPDSGLVNVEVQEQLSLREKLEEQIEFMVDSRALVEQGRTARAELAELFPDMVNASEEDLIAALDRLTSDFKEVGGAPTTVQSEVLSAILRCVNPELYEQRAEEVRALPNESVPEGSEQDRLALQEVVELLDRIHESGDTRSVAEMVRDLPENQFDWLVSTVGTELQVMVDRQSHLDQLSLQIFALENAPQYSPRVEKALHNDPVGDVDGHIGRLPDGDDSLATVQMDLTFNSWQHAVVDGLVQRAKNKAKES